MLVCHNNFPCMLLRYFPDNFIQNIQSLIGCHFRVSGINYSAMFKYIHSITLSNRTFLCIHIFILFCFPICFSFFIIHIFTDYYQCLSDIYNSSMFNNFIFSVSIYSFSPPWLYLYICFIVSTFFIISYFFSFHVN